MTFISSEQHREFSRIASKLGIAKLLQKKQERIDKYNLNPKLCLHCKKSLPYKRKKGKFCNASCSATFNNSRRNGGKRSDETKRKISRAIKNWRMKNPGLVSTNHNAWDRTGCIPWNKGLTKETDNRLMNQSLRTKEKYKLGILKISDENREKNSKRRIEYLKLHPEKIPYRLNHSKNKSRPEMLFENELNKNNITGWIYNYPMSLYQYDFAFVDLKIDVEIDGSTHKQEKVKKIDERRDKFSIDNGWIVVRFTAKEVYDDITSCINKLKLIIDNRGYSLK